ncbi:MAG: hypothetical protein NTY47_00765, partial [Candidatus Omnitrophica bacterium]|nr:hypothetical protein [Candidatus Omnitrophota bacterium]
SDPRSVVNQASRLSRHIAYKNMFTPRLFNPPIDDILQKRLELAVLRWDISDRSLPDYLDKALTLTMGDNLALPEQNLLIAQYNSAQSAERRMDLINGLTLDEGSEDHEQAEEQVVDFLTHLIVNWDLENLSEQEMFGVCDKLRELVGEKLGNEIILTIADYAKSDLANGCIEGLYLYLIHRLNIGRRELDDRLRQIEEQYRYPISSDTALVRAGSTSLERWQSAARLGAVAIIAEKAKRVLGWLPAADIPCDFEKIFGARLRRRIGITSFMGKEEALGVLKAERQKLVKKLQETQDTHEQARITEAIIAISGIMKKEDEFGCGLAAAQPCEYIAPRFPIVRYTGEKDKGYLKKGRGISIHGTNQRVGFNSIMPLLVISGLALAVASGFWLVQNWEVIHSCRGRLNVTYIGDNLGAIFAAGLFMPSWKNIPFRSWLKYIVKACVLGAIIGVCTGNYLIALFLISPCFPLYIYLATSAPGIPVDSMMEDILAKFEEAEAAEIASGSLEVIVIITRLEKLLFAIKRASPDIFTREEVKQLFDAAFRLLRKLERLGEEFKMQKEELNYLITQLIGVDIFEEYVYCSAQEVEIPVIRASDFEELGLSPTVAWTWDEVRSRYRELAQHIQN